LALQEESLLAIEGEPPHLSYLLAWLFLLLLSQIAGPRFSFGKKWLWDTIFCSYRNGWSRGFYDLFVVFCCCRLSKPHPSFIRETWLYKSHHHGAIMGRRGAIKPTTTILLLFLLVLVVMTGVGAGGARTVAKPSGIGNGTQRKSVVAATLLKKKDR